MSQHDPGLLIVDDLPAPRRSLRIATVTETYPPEVNGVSRTVARLVQGLRERHHGVQLVRLRQGGEASPRPDDDVLMRGLPIPHYPNLRMGLPSTTPLVRLWSAQRPDVVHIATEGPLGWSALRAAERLKLPAVSEFRTNFHAYSSHYGLGWLNRPILGYLRKFHNRTRCTMVPTESMRDELAVLGFKHLAVVARGVDTERFHPGHRSEALRRSWGADERTLVIVCVSRLAAEKNLALLGLAAEAAARHHGDVRLVFVGDGPWRETLARQCPNAVFAGTRSGTDLAAHYASADLFVFPSLTETYGNVVPEAMASGLPVLAFDRAAAMLMVEDGVSGWVAAPGDTAGFLERAAQAGRHRGRLPAMGQAARTRAAQAGWSRVVDAFESVLMRAVDHHAPYRHHHTVSLQVP